MWKKRTQRGGSGRAVHGRDPQIRPARPRFSGQNVLVYTGFSCQSPPSQTPTFFGPGEKFSENGIKPPLLGPGPTGGRAKRLSARGAKKFFWAPFYRRSWPKNAKNTILARVARGKKIGKTRILWRKNDEDSRAKRAKRFFGVLF